MRSMHAFSNLFFSFTGASGSSKASRAARKVVTRSCKLIGSGMDPRYRYREVFVSSGGKFRGVFGTELSRQEGFAYESNMEKKKDYLRLAESAGFMGAADTLAKMSQG